MFARIWQLRCIAIGLAVFAVSGCQSTQKDVSPGTSSQTISGLPTDVSQLKEAKPPEILPDTHVAAGRLHESQGKLARAVEQYRLAISAQPNHVEAYNRLGVVLDRLGKFKEADQAFARAIQLAPKEAYLRNNLAFSYIMQTRWAEAEEELNRALELQPEFPRARVNLATVQAQQGRFEEAFRSFSQVLQPEDAYYNMGLMYQSKRRPVEAAQAFQQALRLNPKMVAARKRLDLLPPEARSEAEQRGSLFSFPVALSGRSDTEDAVRSQQAAEDREPAPSSEAAAPATQPAGEAVATDDDPFVERTGSDEWIFSKLTAGSPEPTSWNDQGAEAVSRIRSAIEPLQQLLSRLPTLAMDLEDGGLAVEGSPLPPEVPAPEMEGPPAPDVDLR